MKPSDVESMIRNLNARTTRIEQILPTLATKDDVREGVAESKRHTLVLFEDLKSDIRLLAEHLASQSQRLDQHSTILARHSTILDQHSTILDQHSQKLDALIRKVDRLAIRK